jgi:hypothetical protein
MHLSLRVINAQVRYKIIELYIVDYTLNFVLECKQLFHTKCIQNGGVQKLPCQHASGGGKPGRRKHRKHSRTPYDMNKPQGAGKFSLTGTSEFTDSTDKIISDARELQLMQDFITNKVSRPTDYIFHVVFNHFYCFRSTKLKVKKARSQVRLTGCSNRLSKSSKTISSQPIA